MSLTIRTLISSASVVIGLALAPWAVQAQDHHIVMPPDQVKFGPAPQALPAGAKIAVLQGDPSAAGPVVLRLAFPANFVVPPHWHSNAERLTIISGTLYVGAGDTVDRQGSAALAAGGYAYLPPKMHHYAWTKAAAVVQINLDGPFDIFYINPNDDPRKSPGTR
jgi:hypothetical protein